VFNRANLVKERTMFEGLFQPTHLLVIFGIALLVFGPKKLPELGKGIGEGIRGFKSAIKAEEDKPATAGHSASIGSTEVDQATIQGSRLLKKGS
jgi:sec-independent protein translocase protein TatA